MNIPVIIYEDNTELRQGLGALIGGTDGYELVGSFPTADHCLEEIKMLKPAVVLMDIDMPGISGIEALLKIRAEFPGLHILMLTVFDDNKNVFESIKAGANGYLLKKTPPARLLEAIKEANEGGAPMTPSVARQVLQLFSNHSFARSEEYHLSPRETDVLRLLVDGHSYKMIAAELSISMDTVRSHIRKIYEKLHVNSRGEAVAKAFRQNIV